MSEPVTVKPSRTIIPAGTRLNGIYEIDEPIAAGGMGEIYKGHAIETGDRVALKLMRPDLDEAQAAFALFRKEASALHNLVHDAIVRYYIFSIDPALKRPYLAMEFVDGKSLSAILRGGPLAFEAVHRLMQRLAAGLRAAHERGIIHRDVSPDNIIVPSGDMGRAKIIDFGIARSTRLGDEATVIGTGFAGKHNYVSPEQLGLYGSNVTPKSDIYSLGLVLAEALLGRPIDMGGSPVEVLDKRRKVPDLGGIDARLRPLIARMLEPDPAKRPASMAEIAAFAAEPAKPDPGREMRRSASSRPSAARAMLAARPKLVAAGIVSAIFAVAAGTWLLGSGLAPPEVEALAPVPELEPAPAEPSRGTIDRSGPSPGSRSARAEPPVTLIDRSAAAAAFIHRYDGGDCFFARPVATSGTRAAIEGFGRSTVPFHALDDALSREIGIAADIGMHEVAERQCPALDFLRELRATPASDVGIDLAGRSLAIGEPLAGTVSGLGGRTARVFVIGDDGMVHAVPTKRRARGDDALGFQMPTTPALRNGKLQLVLAVVSPEALTSLRATARTSAVRLFPRALAEAKRRNLPLAATAGSFAVAR